MKTTPLMLLVCLSVTSSALASPWLCRAFDEFDKHWLAFHSVKQNALNKAYTACRNSSMQPESCQTATGLCVKNEQAQLLTTRWQCSAMDDMGQRFRSEIAHQRERAIDNAKQICKEHSVFPNSCYVRLLTCNKQSSSSV